MLTCLHKFPFREMGGGPNAKVALPESRTPSRWPRAGRLSHTSVALGTPEGAGPGHAGGGGGPLRGGVSGRRGRGRDLTGRFAEPRWALPPPN